MSDSQRAPRMYSTGPRALQEHFDSTRLADRLVDLLSKEELEDWQADVVSKATFFFLSTVDTDGWPDVSYKGGAPGFVQLLDRSTLAFPHYDGNGMYRSIGNIMDTGKVSLLFVDFENKLRVRVHATAVVHLEREWLDRFPEAEAVVEIKIGRAFPNCPRYLHNLATGELSPNAPRAGHTVEAAEWKEWPDFKDVVPKKH